MRDGVGLTNITHPTKLKKDRKRLKPISKNAVETVEIELPFNKKVYQRQYMRKYRAAKKLKLSKG